MAAPAESAYRPVPEVEPLPLPRAELARWTWRVRAAALALPGTCATVLALGTRGAHLARPTLEIGIALSVVVAVVLVVTAERVVRGELRAAFGVTLLPAAVALAGSALGRAEVYFSTLGHEDPAEASRLAWQVVGASDLAPAHAALVVAGTAAIAAFALLASAASVGALGAARPRRVRGRELVLGLLGLVASTTIAIVSHDGPIVGLGAVPVFLGLTALAAGAAERGRFVREHGGDADVLAWGASVLGAGVLAAEALVATAWASSRMAEARELVSIDPASVPPTWRFLALEALTRDEHTTTRVAFALAALAVLITASAASAGLPRPRGPRDARALVLVVFALASVVFPVGVELGGRAAALALVARSLEDRSGHARPEVDAAAIEAESPASRALVVTLEPLADGTRVTRGMIPPPPLGPGRIALEAEGSTRWRDVAHAIENSLPYAVSPSGHLPELELRVTPRTQPARDRLGERAALLGPWRGALVVQVVPALGPSEPADLLVTPRPGDTLASVAARVAAATPDRDASPRRRVVLVLAGDADPVSP